MYLWEQLSEKSEYFGKITMPPKRVLFFLPSKIFKNRKLTEERIQGRKSEGKTKKRREMQEDRGEEKHGGNKNVGSNSPTLAYDVILNKFSNSHL